MKSLFKTVFLIVYVLITLIHKQPIYANDSESAYTKEDILCTVDGVKLADWFRKGEFQVQVPIKTTEVPMLIIAQYRSNSIIKCSMGNPSDDGQTLVSSFSIKETEETEIKVFLWKNHTSINPLILSRILKPSATIYINETFDDEQLSLNKVIRSGDTLTVSNGYARLVQGEKDESEVTELSSYLQLNFSDTSQNVILEGDFRIGDVEGDVAVPSAQLFFVRDSISQSGNLDSPHGILSNGVHAPTETDFKKHDWTRISMALDLSRNQYAIYINGELKQSGGAIRAAGFAYLSMWRIFIAGSSTGVIEMDNLRAYDGVVPVEIGSIEAMERSIFNDIERKQLLIEKTALSPYVDIIYYNNQKFTTDIPCIIEGDEALISEDTFEKLFGEAPSILGSSIHIGNSEFTVGEKMMRVLGEAIDIEAAPQIVDKHVMIPARAYGIHILGDKFYDDAHGMFIVSDSSIPNTSNMNEASNYLFFHRYTPAQLLKKLKLKWGQDLSSSSAHPRILATQSDFDRIKAKLAEGDSYTTEWYNILKAYVDDSISPTGNGRFIDTYTYDTSTEKLRGINSKGTLESVSSIMINCALECGMLYHLSDDETEKQKYASACINLMKQFCEYPDWYPGHHLETGEMELGIAIGYDWLYDALTEEDKEIIYNRAKKNGLEANRAVYYNTAKFDNAWWGKTNTNWGGVVNSGAIALSLAIAEMDVEYNMDILNNALRSLEYSIYKIAPDGAWHEGTAYWQYYFDHLTYAVASYETAIGENHEAIYYKGIDKMCLFKDYFTMPNGYSSQFNDGGSGKYESFGRLYFANKRKRNDVAKSYINNYEKVDKGYGSSGTVHYAAMNLLWYESDLANSELEYALDGYFRETEFISMRENWSDKDAMFVMTDAGESSSSHGHLDTGSFQLMLNGILWARDLSSESLFYSRTGTNYLKNAGKTEKLYYRRKSEGHNMVIINPSAEKLEIDPYVNTAISSLFSGTDGAFAYMDLTEAYGKDNVNEYKRGYMISDNRRAFTVRDEINLLADNSDVYWFMHYVYGADVGEVTTLGNTKKVTITKNNQILELIFYVEKNGLPTTDYTLENVPAERMIDIYGLTADKSTSVSIKSAETSAEKNGDKLKLSINASGEISITVKMYMQNEEVSGINTSDISSWMQNTNEFMGQQSCN